MEYRELFQIFFSVLQKSKYNMLKMGSKTNPAMAMELAKIIDRATLELYKIASMEGMELVYHMEQMDRCSDTTYGLEPCKTKEEFAKEITDCIHHLQRHLREELEIYGRKEQAPIVSKLMGIAEGLYDLQWKIQK